MRQVFAVLSGLSANRKHPETGFGEINGDVLESDLSRSIAEKLLTLQRGAHQPHVRLND
jgi:hypothetical protein